MPVANIDCDQMKQAPLAMGAAKAGAGEVIMGEMGDAPRLNAVYGAGR